MRPVRSARQRGFTLLEVVVAIALTALIAVTVAALVNGLVAARERFDEAPALRRDARFMQLLERRLEALVVRPVHAGGQPLFTAPLDYRPDTQTLDWVAMGDWPLPVGDHYTRLRRQRLEWDSDSRRLWLGSTGLLDDAGTPQWQPSAVLDDIEQVEFAFYDGTRWLAAPPGKAPARGLRIRWQRHGALFQASILLPYREGA